MKLIIRQYLASLKERGELDVVLPDLLSQLGLTVFSRPARGTRQSGVDVGAVGSLDGGPEKVYLFTIKPGDLTRSSWNDGSPQAVRQSLDEIQDAYIPNRLPTEHRDKDIVICLCCGGDIQEQVRELWEGYGSQRSRGRLSFQEWNGDRLADLIQASFLREDLLPDSARSLFRKSLAMLDEPEVSYRHFAALIRAISDVDNLRDPQRVTAIRQMSICLWILFAWAREAKNLEAAYLASELTLLHAWSVVRLYAGQSTKTAEALESAYYSIFSSYKAICAEFLRSNVLPYCDKLHAVSSAVNGSCSLDINLKLFDLLGRLALEGIWAYWGMLRCPDDEHEAKEVGLRETQIYMEAVKHLISNNPVLLLPAKDEQAIDIVIAALLLAIDRSNHRFIASWLTQIMDRARFTYEVNSNYPCVLHTYSELLEHPKSSDSEYRKHATTGTVLYPSIALLAALLGDDATYSKVVAMKQELLEHCTFQFWFPDECSEQHFYMNTDGHGAALANLAISHPKEDFVSQVFSECELSPQFNELSAVKFGWWPLTIVACRHYRLPISPHLLKDLRGAVDTSIAKAHPPTSS